MQWGSIGSAVPAAFGYGMALEPDRRLVAVIGDGCFQLTAQEVANMVRYGQKMSRLSREQPRYVIDPRPTRTLQLLQELSYAGVHLAFNAENGHGLGLKATTAGELADAIKRAGPHKGGPVLSSVKSSMTTAPGNSSRGAKRWLAPMLVRLRRTKA